MAIKASFYGQPIEIAELDAASAQGWRPRFD
jgi:hypothetical protein